MVVLVSYGNIFLLSKEHRLLILRTSCVVIHDAFRPVRIVVVGPRGTIIGISDQGGHSVRQLPRQAMGAMDSRLRACARVLLCASSSSASNDYCHPGKNDHNHRSDSDREEDRALFLT
jgi:hypothetical protein